MNVQELKSLLDVLSLGNNKDDDSVYEIGKNYFIRTVTMHHVGKLVKVTDKELLLEGASWVADSGRFNNALLTGKFSEVEPFVSKTVIVGRGALIDATVFNHDLPTEVIG